MKICVFSDSHGTADNMITAIELEHPEMCFFLGDGSRDIERIGKRYPEMPIYAVKGNCDFMSKFDTSLRCEIDGVCIFAVHGHQSSVKYEDRLDTLTSQALDADADIALFGHTHMQYIAENEGVTLINPGSVGDNYYPGYAVLTIENGKYSADLKAL